MKRVKSVDIFKAIGIIFMLFSHTALCDQILVRYFNCFYMPMFFCISGYFYHDNSFLKVTIKKAKALLIPYLGIGLLGIFIDCVVVNPGGIDISYALDALFIHSYNIPVVGAIWFLIALFWAEEIFTILKRTNNKIIFHVGCIAVAMTGCTLRRIFFAMHTDYVRPIWNIDSAMTAVGFMYIGYLAFIFKETKIVKCALNLPKYIILPMLIVNIYLASITYITMWANDYKNIPLLWINGIMGSIIWYSISKHIDNSKILEVQALGNLLAYIGKNSIIFLCWNQLVLYVFKKILRNNAMWPKTETETRIWFVVFFVFTLLALLAISHINIRRKELTKRFKQYITEKHAREN
ncbi:acyltransferase [uncultured Eubacterium sp.]|uniref:acyltransferase family protein n=1 Tax=uncultured Eubacterium sp. TaxID=165185 RepID=UPI000EC8A625|nr:acyltransferase [uncultured Eubacterium sp.]HAH18651.1 hypothetical protein [Eubacterium sp.]